MSENGLDIQDAELRKAEGIDGVDDEPADVAELVPQDFKAMWKTLSRLSDQQILEEVDDQRDGAPERSRKVLVAWMAQKLGYSRLWRRQSSLTREPLWDALSASSYAKLAPTAEPALAMVGRSTEPSRSFMHPSAALATLALWRHSDDESLQQEARRRLQHHPLPDDPEWLYELVGVFIEDDAVDEPNGGRSLAELVELVLDESYWEVAALLCGLLMVHRYGKWYRGAVESNLTHACDTAARQYPHQSQRWLDCMADAAIGGRLSYRWVEAPVEAAIRLNIDDPKREARLRRFFEGRPFDADYKRLESLYRRPLESLGTADDDQARRRLFSEVRTTVERHPTRALRLLELMAMHRYGPAIGSRFYRMRKAIERVGVGADDELCGWLVGLYVHSATLESHAVQLVHLVGDDIDWEQNPFADRRDYEMYRVIGDYERAFEQLTAKFDGVELEHADKYAAARVKFFVRKRVDPSRIHRLVQTLFRPVEWIGSGLTEVGFISDAVDRGMERFEARFQNRDRRREVMERFAQADVAIDGFEGIATLPVDRVDCVVDSLRHRRMLLGAAAGGASGGLAPYSWGMLSLADIPVMLSITADVCSRFCWYYGFDPRNHPDLPFEILAVALGGTRPEAVEPMLVRQSLHSHVMRKSIVVGALAHGGMTHLTGKGVSQLIERRVQKTMMQRAGDFARRALRRNVKRRAATSRSSPGMSVVGALVGAALNTVLLYDICEAAQAVLTDRFLERKYPGWARHIDRVDSSSTTTDGT